MKGKLLLLLVLLGIGFTSDAQRWKRYRWEAIYGIGAANFLGELGGADQVGTNYLKDFELKMTRPALQAGLRFKQTQQISWKMALTAGMVAGDDALTNDPIRNERGLSFMSPLVELSGTFEFYLRKEKRGHRFKLRGVKGIKSMGIYPYGFFGISAFYFAPYGKIDNKWRALRALNTEGQTLSPTRDKYSNFQLAIPLGVGLKYSINRRWLIGVEFAISKTFTDYIDDVSTTYYPNDQIQDAFGTTAAMAADPTGGTWIGSAPYQQRGDPTDNDSYMFLIFSANYKLKTTRGGLPKLR